MIAEVFDDFRHNNSKAPAVAKGRSPVPKFLSTLNMQNLILQKMSRSDKCKGNVTVLPLALRFGIAYKRSPRNLQPTINVDRANPVE